MLAKLWVSPRKYRDPRGGPVRIGLDATLLPKVCEVWLRARDAKALEATGYQRDRAKDALNGIPFAPYVI